VLYAKDRGIRVIPEIDTPSHSDILTRIYPEYMTVCNCDGSDCPLNHTFLSMPDPTNEQTWEFLEKMITAVASMFPDEAFHIGGDEWWPAWQYAPTVQNWMPKMNFTDVIDVYHYYERGMIDIIRGLKKVTFAWEDIDGFSQEHWNTSANSYNDYPDVTLSIWAGWAPNKRSWQDAASYYTSNNASVILTGPWYINSRMSSYPDSTWDGFYMNDPQNFTGTAHQLGLMKGGHVSVWDDAANSDASNMVEVTFPPASSVAEVLWSPQSMTTAVGPNAGRMHSHRCRMVSRGIATAPMEINYCLVEYVATLISPPAQVQQQEEYEMVRTKMAAAMRE